MVNRRAFFEIFFYNRENRSREMMEAAESVWRAYMKKYGLGLDAGIDGQPTYDEVREITYLANAAIEAVEKQIAEAEAEEARRKKLQREAWDLGIFAPDTTGAAELEAMVLKAMNKQTEGAEEEVAEEVTEEAAAEASEEVTEEIAEEAAEEETAEETIEEATEEAEEEETVEEAAEEVTEEIIEETVEEAVEEVPVSKAPVKEKVSEAVLPVVAPVVKTAAAGGVSLWAEEITRWCQSKNLLCIQTVDDGDVYLHVYLPHKKKVHPIGSWCLKKDANGADYAAEMTKLYAYCEGFADCFEQLVK